MSALTDSARLVDFVLWEMRTSDLPADVRDAAHRLIEQRPERPAHLAGVIHYAEGPLTIDGVSRDEADGVERRRVHVHEVGAAVRELLERRCRYILIQDL